MTELSRREFLQGLAAAYGMTMMGCSRRRDPFAQEQVCIHIYQSPDSVPPPLMENTRSTSGRDAGEKYFDIGLPELVACTTRVKFLDMFQYFWPFSRDDFELLQQAIKIRYSVSLIRGAADVENFAKYLRDHRSDLAGGVASSAVIFTFNDFTRQWSRELITGSRQAGIQEFVLFKDPSRSPYLCEYPARQKGFKRPPP